MKKAGKNIGRRCLKVKFVLLIAIGILACTTYDAGISLVCKGCDDLEDIAAAFESKYPSAQYRDMEVHARVTVTKRIMGTWYPILAYAPFDKLCGWTWGRALRESSIDWDLFEEIASVTSEGGQITDGGGTSSDGLYYEREIVPIYGTTCGGGVCYTRVVAWTYI